MLPPLESPSRFTRCLCRSLVTGIWFQVGDYWSRCSKWPQSCSLGRYSVMQYQKQWYLAKYFLLLKYALQARFTSYFTHAHAYSTDIYIEPLLCARHSARSWRCGSEKDWQKSLSTPASETESSVFHLILFYILWGFGFPTLTREPSELFHWFRVFASKPCLLSFVLSCSFHSSYPESSLLKSWSRFLNTFFPKFRLMKSYVLIDFSCRFTLFLSLILFPIVLYCKI